MVTVASDPMLPASRDDNKPSDSAALDDRTRPRVTAEMVFAVGGVASAAAFSAIALGLIVGFFFFRDALDLSFSQAWGLIAAFVANAFVAFLVGLGLYMWRQRREEQEAARERARGAVADLASDSHLPALIKANRLHLEAYDVLVRDQAASAYRNSQLAMAAGFLILLAAIGFAIAGGDAASKAIAAGLSAVVGVLTGYLGKTFLAVHQSTVEQLNRYSEQPLNTSYLLAAERTAAETSDPVQRDALVGEVVARTLALLHAGQSQLDGGAPESDGPPEATRPDEGAAPVVHGRS
jgi:hypothetical protein